MLSRRPGVISADANPASQTASISYRHADRRWRGVL
ncbi:hypothetical protein [Cryobacterium glaciale]